MQAVIFDLDGTLYDYDTLDRVASYRARKLVCDKIGVEAEQYAEALRRAKRTIKDSLGDVASSHNRMLYFQKTMEYLDIRPLYLALEMYDTYWGTFLDKMELFPGARRLLDKLYEKGIRVGVCSNMTAKIQYRKLLALGMKEDVDCLVTSEEAGVEKPAPEIFDLCLKKMRIPAEEIFFVGDEFTRDVKGAMAAGMRAIWFRRRDILHPETVESFHSGEGYEIVTDYDELYELLLGEKP